MARTGRPKIEILTLTIEERAALERLAARPRSNRQMAFRAKVVLRCAEGKSNQDVARELRAHRGTVGKWRSRFIAERLDGLHDPGAVVVLATALQQGPSKKSVTKLSVLLGISRRTLVRWRRWWSTMFATSRFWKGLRGRFMPAVDEAAMPASMLSAMSPTDEPALVALLRLLAPVSTRPGLEASAM